MRTKIHDTTIHYIQYGNEQGKDYVLLHGWGQNIEMMKMLGDPFQKEYHITILDLPGFGESEEPNYVWSIFDYVEYLHAFLESLSIKKPIIVGHSFGGKLALLYASMYPVEKLVLLAPTFKKSTKDTSMKTKVLKTLKKVPGLNKLESFAKKHIGSTDYRNASVTMRQILTKHIQTDIQEECKKIKCPSLIIWGTKDEAVPYSNAKELENLISDAGVVTYEGCTHYAYLERLDQTIQVLKSFYQ